MGKKSKQSENNKMNDLEEVADCTDAEPTGLKNSFTLSEEDKERKNKNKHGVGDDIELDSVPDEIENGKGYLKVDGDLQKEKSHHHQKKRKLESSEEITECGGVDNSIKSSEKHKTRKNKREHYVGGDISLYDTRDEALHGKDTLEVDSSLQKENDQKKKKKKNRKLESGEDTDTLNEKTQREAGDKGCSQTVDLADAGKGNELKSRKDEKKMHKQREKDGSNTVFSSRKILAGENMGSTEVGAKEKKKNKGGRDVEEKKKTKDGKDIGKSSEDCDGDVFEEVGKKKRKKEKKKDKDDLGAGLQETFTVELGNETTTFGDKDFSDNESNVHPTITKMQDSEAKKGNKGKRKKTKSVENETENPKAKSKKVSFSGHVDVFPSSDKSTGKEKDQEDDLVRGKRFSREEDEIVKEAVLNYINVHGLGKEGLNMVLHCRSYPELKNCWKEIGAAIPYRPSSAIYYRAHILFERDENRTWTKEEYELIRKFQVEHGNNWKLLADELGKHRFHVKDTWRRIKLPNMKKGHWSQEEYQTLFDLVNKDLQMKASEEKKSKHGMLRDNICWSAISDQLSTRANATCCRKWYQQLTSSLVVEGKWADVDDYRLLDELFNLDACCVEDVDWDSLLEHRSGDVCRKRWDQMVLHIGQHGSKSFAEQVDILAKRYCPYLIEARAAWDSKPVVPC